MIMHSHSRRLCAHCSRGKHGLNCMYVVLEYLGTNAKGSWTLLTKMKRNLPRGTAAYCCLSLGFTMLSRSFGFYYLKVFLNLYNVKETWFHLSQVLFMIWNAINDPLFALLQDNTNSFLTRTRREGIFFTAPLFAMSYMIAWLPFGQSDWAVGIHLIAALCIYDTLYTFIGLLSCCLFTELNVCQTDRLLLTRYSTITSLIGSQSIFLLEFSSDGLRDFTAFQATSLGISVVASLLMMYAGLHAHTTYDIQAKVTFPAEETCKDPGSENQKSFCRNTVQILQERNFIAFVVTNFFQEFHKAYLSGFMAIFCDHLIPDSQVPVSVRSIFYGLTGTLGGLAVIFGTPLIERLGYFHVIRYNFVWKFFGGLTIFFMGPSSPWLLMFFILLDSSFATATFSLFNLPLADIADHDKEKYNRRHHISSTVFATNALIVKPSQSLAPMIVVAVLNAYGYEELKAGSLPTYEMSVLKSVMFQILCIFPILLAVVQYFSWSQFTIRHRIIEQTIDV